MHVPLISEKWILSLINEHIHVLAYIVRISFNRNVLNWMGHGILNYLDVNLTGNPPMHLIVQFQLQFPLIFSYSFLSVCIGSVCSIL